jgi:hypothetical protein
MNKRIVRVVVLALVTLGTYIYYSLLRPRAELATSDLDTSKMHQGTIIQRPRLKTTNTTNETAERILGAEFAIRQRIAEIGAPCISSFSSSFPGRSSQNGSIEIADPGDIFQYSDALFPKAPFRRLVFAGETSTRCFIYYQHGGVDYPRFCLAVMDYSKGRAIWVGEARTEAPNLGALRGMLRSNQFDTKGSGSC